MNREREKFAYIAIALSTQMQTNSELRYYLHNRHTDDGFCRLGLGRSVEILRAILFQEPRLDLCVLEAAP